jgi:shikimate dehydrogenase
MRRQMENIILIGMPGCGKSTVGKLLAERFGKTFVDADDELVKTYGMEIPAIFASEGEAGFRIKETTVLAQLGKKAGLIIATGGGCVTRPENYPLLHQNGIIFWVMRDLDHLAMDGRPLSQPENMRKMYDQRKPLYNAFSDFTVSNDCDPEETVSSILALLEE